MRIRYSLLLAFLLFAGIFSCGSGGNGSNDLPTPTPETYIKFFSFGDWGTGDSNQQAVADAVSTFCKNNSCDFGLLLGDNFYNTGVADTSDPQWQSKYQNVYHSLNLPLYALLGNHDWDSPANPQAEIDYSSLDPTWKMPAAYYSQVFPSSDNPLLQLIIINSNDFKTNTDEQNWLSSQLAQSTAPWKILAFHHPVYSNGSGHTPDEKQIYPMLKPIICGKIDMLLSGHDHFFSHLRNSSENCGYDQLVIGTGGKTLYAISPVNSAPANVLFTEQNFGLGYFSIKQNEITFQFIKSTSETSYSYQWQK